MTRTVQPLKSLHPLTPDDRLRHVPYAFRHTSATLGWNGLRVEYNTRQPASDFVHPPLECLMLVLTGEIFPERADHRCDDARYSGDGLPHAVNLLPPGVESRWRWRNTGDLTDSTHYQLSPALVAKVAEQAFDLDPARFHFPVRYYDQSSPEVIATLTALRRELVTGGPGGRLCAESLANVLVVQLIRQMSNRQGSGGGIREAGGRLPRHALRAVEEYIHAHLDQNISLADLADVAHLSEFHFARLFKQTTGLPPYQFVIHQRVERAKRLIAARQLSLVQIAIAVGFSDQSQLNRHFKRLVGVTPRRFA
ncbi:HTH-type transcriptional activator Btr [Stieleria maiorica]|uniref:HTH-type transcriptional activator Btr n=1 Tax=Stieleria maiorica TaxID=2795974 RepID=A0A5B9MRV5_9BACT|nr:HTH-type transcriptional activator Btr [Stieleria maiorica]